MKTLSIKITDKYVGSFQHLDEWRDVASYEIVRTQRLPVDDPDDICEPILLRHSLIVRPKHGATDEEIKQAIRSTFTQWGCAHEYDCCGCRSHAARKAKKVKDGIWSVEVFSSRNF